MSLSIDKCNITNWKPKYEDDSFFLFDTYENARVGNRFGTAKTDYG